MTELEKKIAAKIPGEDTGIEIRKTFCSICSPAFHCGVDAYVKDETVIKVEGTKGHPMNDGLLCTKGCNNRAYIYREDRLQTPLKRVGNRGEGKFEPISWEQAYDIIAENLLSLREKYGANSVAFFGGYQKWYRWLLQRFAYVYGSVNYGTESSVCFTSSLMAWKTMTGMMARPDMKNSKLFLAWGSGNHHSRHLNARSMEALKARGGKLIVVDPRLTPMAMRTADLHLRVRPGTDGLLANCIAGIIIRNGWQAQDYIDKYVYGFDAYKSYVTSLDVEEVSRTTTVPVADIQRAAEMIGTIGPMSCECNPTSVIHQTNGYQTMRSVFALLAITGNYDVAGGNQPNPITFCDQGAGYLSYESEFENERTPAGFENRVGCGRFPVWGALIHQMQAVDLPRQINEGTPYPIRGLFALGLNRRIFPDSEGFRRALEKLDFFVDADLFMTDAAKYADIVLPVCSSFEREEIKVYPGGYAKYYKPVIQPLYDSRNDAQILQELAIRMDLDDELLKSGYRQCAEHIFRDTGFDFEELIASPLPVKAPGLKAYVPLEYLENGCQTPTGKLELYSTVVEKAGAEKGLEPLPKWYEPAVNPDEEYPFLLLAGIRIPNAIHSHLHKVPWARSLRPFPMADISLEDAQELGLSKNDDICLYNQYGAIQVKANPTAMITKGQVSMYHGYSEADVNLLFDTGNTDPYSGFPGFKHGSCNIRKL